MTREDFFELKTAKEMWRAIVEDPNLRDNEITQAFQEKRFQEFKERIIAHYGSYDPDMYYDFNKKKK